MQEFLENTYTKLFVETWPKWLGGVILALLNIALFLYLMPFSGIYPAMANWGVWIYKLAGIDTEAPWGYIQLPHLSIISVLTIALVLGSLIGSLFSKKFKIRKAGAKDYSYSFVGGMLMGLGSFLAGSCIIGGFYSSIMALSLSGFYMMIGLILGGYIGGKVKPWIKRKEVRNGVSIPEGMEEKKYVDYLPKIGIVVSIAVLALISVYFIKGMNMLGNIALFGLAFGLVFQRSGFGFSSVFRDFFNSKTKEQMRALLLSIGIGVIGFSIIKAAELQPANMLVMSAGWSAVMGGLIFGFGMVIADG